MRQKIKPGAKKLVLTGGHAATTAYAVVGEIVKREKGWHVYFIGYRHAVEGKNIPTLESIIYPKIGISFYGLFTGRLQRHLNFWTIPSLLKIPFGFLHALFLLLKIRPDIVLSFGGFVGFPVVFCAWLLKIPAVIHEQTSTIGRANKFSSLFAKKIALSRKESLKYFPSEKCVVVGNPILSKIAKVKSKSELGEPVTIYVTGGSRGSQIINSKIERIIRDLANSYMIIHQTGFLDFKKFKEIKNNLPERLSKYYEVHKVIDPTEIDNIYRRADIVVCRSGANTVSEIIVTRRPAILIPLPFSYMDEQTGNALFAQKFGIAKIIQQKDLSPKILLSTIEDVRKNWKNMVTQSKKKVSPDIHASKKLVDLLEEYL